MVTEQNFLNLERRTSTAFIILGMIIVTYFLADLLVAGENTFGFLENASFYNLLVLNSFFILPFIILGLGVIFFLYTCFKFVRTKSYLSNPISLRKQGSRMVLKWFAITFAFSIIMSSFYYFAVNMRCASFSIWADVSYDCSLLEFYWKSFTGRELTSILYLFVVTTYVSTLAAVNVIGFGLDKYLSKKFIS